MLKRLISFWPILLLLSITFILRIYKIEQLFYFTYDESIPAFVGRRLILWNHIPLIGAVTPFGFHLAPYFYWFYALLLFIGKLNPIIWGYTAAALSVVTTFLIFKVGGELGGRRLAISAAILWTFSQTANLYDRHLWALFWGPIISLLTLLCLYKIIKGKEKFIYILAPTLALGFHADPSNLVFLFLTIIIWSIYKLPIKRSTFIAAFIFIISFLPLVIFDFRHNFSNSRPILDFIKLGRNTPTFNVSYFQENLLLFPRSASRLIFQFGDSEVSKQYSYCSSYVSGKFEAIPPLSVLIAGLGIIAFIIYATKKGRNQEILMITAILIFLYFIGIQVYGTIFRSDVFEHYITGLFPVFMLITASYISRLPKKIWLLVLSLFVFFNLYKLSLAKNSMGLEVKRQAIEFTMQKVEDKPFSLDSLSTCWKYNGYRYLFAVFGREPVKSYVDPNLSYLYGSTAVAKIHPPTVVAFVVNDFLPETEDFYKRYTLLKSHEITSSTFGNLEVVIVDNASDWFERGSY